jgi:glutamine---fructose-6-phosphate transaminase (isomerizing)
MCGIVGYVGEKDTAPLLLSGLKRLEYRGYDSAGIAVITSKGLEVVRSAGKLKNLEELVQRNPPHGGIGIGHTRWATHGRPTDENAHPHTFEGVAVVHNGIIENHAALKAELRKKGHTFSSDTDTEIVAHLVAEEIKGGLELREAVRAALARVKGTYAIAVVATRFPTLIVVAKNASPLVLGIGKDENFVASDVPALLEHTRDVIFLEEGEIAEVTRDGARIFRIADGMSVARLPRRIDWTPVMAEKDGHKHFMHKEIHEQPRAVADTLRGRVLIEEGDVFLEDADTDRLRRADKVVLLACGSSYYASLVGRAMIERLARVGCEVELGSEFRFRDAIIDPHTVVVPISQSGETLDTLAALREAKSRGAYILSICNVLGSAITRESNATFYTRAGPEIGVCSTKCFTAQLAALCLLAVKLGRLRGALTPEAARDQLQELLRAPQYIERTLKVEDEVRHIAQSVLGSRNFLFLGRGPFFPIAYEGALKLKEISYLHAEGYAAGEMKHGPIALIEPGLPVVFVAPHGPGYEKLVGNVEEVRARGGKVIAVVDADDDEIAHLADASIRIPKATPFVSAILAVVPLQLLAYHVADLRGTDVDQPRNLAKSVTVE